MLSTDRGEFETQMRTLCEGFNLPAAAKLEAYWTGMAKMSLVEFTRCVEHALGEQGPEKFPTTGQLWRIRAQLRARGSRTCAAPIDTSHATVQEQLCEFVMKKLGSRQVAKGCWAFRYREWIEQGKRCNECTSMSVDLIDGTILTFTVADMLIDPIYPLVLRKFAEPGPRPNAAQIARHREAVATIAARLQR